MAKGSCFFPVNRDEEEEEVEEKNEEEEEEEIHNYNAIFHGSATELFLW